MKVDWLAVRGPVIASAFSWFLPSGPVVFGTAMSMGCLFLPTPAVFSAGDQVPCCQLSPAIWLMCGFVLSVFVLRLQKSIVRPFKGLEHHLLESLLKPSPLSHH